MCGFFGFVNVWDNCAAAIGLTILPVIVLPGGGWSVMPVCRGFTVSDVEAICVRGPPTYEVLTVGFVDRKVIGGGEEGHQ